MSETAILNKKHVHLEAPPNEGGKSSGSALGSPSLQDDNESSGDQGAAPELDAEDSKPPSIKPETTSLNEESQRSAPAKGKQSDETIENLMALFRDFLESAPNQATSNSTHTKRNTTTGRKRFFGLNKGLSPETGSNNRYDYEQKYPSDRFGEEIADNARVWLTYLDEAEAFDRERVEGWKETADVLLVFAGLFSGVITTFVSQASQSLQQDNTLVSASLLFEIAQLLRAPSSGIPISHVPNSTLTLTSPFTPSTNAFLVNGLWFTSLAITLSTALFAVLAKQWLYYYLTSITGTAHEKVRARQLRFKGFELWKVGAIVDLLPILLHLAVGVFLMGIIILLFPLDDRVAWTIVVITGITYTLYFISVILPIRYPECPYTTSLTIYAGVLVFSLRAILRWISKTSGKGFRAVWRGINFEARHTIRRLLRYIQGLLRNGFTFIFKFIGVMCRVLRKLRVTIFTERLPQFTEWREENIKKAVKHAVSLDIEAIIWLYATSPNRSVRRIIARCAAVHPIIGEQFQPDILRETLDVSETNVADLRYGLCLDILAGKDENWCLLQSIPDVEESQLEEAEYRSYSRIAEDVIGFERDEIMTDAINGNLEFPLAMWGASFFTVAMSRNASIATHILTDGHGSSLFDWKYYDPTRGLIPNVGVVSFDSEELGWWKFQYLYYHFFLTAPDYSKDVTFETRYSLLITIYRNLTESDEPLIADKEQKQKSLSNLFDNFSDWLFPLRVSPKQYLAFFIDIFCADAFWSESMTDDSRWDAVRCLDDIWRSMGTDMVNQFPFTECDDLTPIYQWCSRGDLDQDHSWCTAPVFTLLFMPQNRTRLCTILSRDPDAVSHLTNCFRNMDNPDIFRFDRECIYPNLMDLLKSVNPKEPLFDILYNSSVLVLLWKFIWFQDLDAKRFLLIVKSKLDQEKLNDLYAAMDGQERFVENLFNASDKAKDFAQRGLRFIANWTNQALRSLRLKTRSGNRDRDVDVELS